MTLVPGGPSAGEMPVTTGGGLIFTFIVLLSTQGNASLNSFLRPSTPPPPCSSRYRSRAQISSSYKRIHDDVIVPTSFPGSLSSASRVVEREPGNEVLFFTAYVFV